MGRDTRFISDKLTNYNIFTATNPSQAFPLGNLLRHRPKDTVVRRTVACHPTTQDIGFQVAEAHPAISICEKESYELRTGTRKTVCLVASVPFA